MLDICPNELFPWISKKNSYILPLIITYLLTKSKRATNNTWEKFLSFFTLFFQWLNWLILKSKNARHFNSIPITRDCSKEELIVDRVFDEEEIPLKPPVIQKWSVYPLYLKFKSEGSTGSILLPSARKIFIFQPVAICCKVLVTKFLLTYRQCFLMMFL